MKTRILVTAGLVLAVCMAAGAADGPIVPDRKIMLFNGKNLDGWKPYLRGGQGDPKQTWSVRDGKIVCTGRPSGYIRTEADYADYRLHVEWRWPGKGGNSGVLVHMSGPDKVWPKSIECQLMSGSAGDFFVIGGTDFKEHKGQKGRRTPKAAKSSEKPLGQWNSYDIVCKGGSILPYVNGVLQNTATEATVRCGKICLQSEGRPIEFRNVYVEPLKPAPIVPDRKIMLFNGRDFTGWTFHLRPPKNDPAPDPKKTWSIKDGVIVCQGTPAGYIRTKADYADYKLHVEWRWPGRGGNSGVLVHMSGPDRVWPKSIECQLMSGNAGDFWLIGGTDIKEHKGMKGWRKPKIKPSSEKPLGQWNSYDIICKGGSVLPHVNGVLQNTGTEATVRSGKIVLQSEGRLIEFRNIYIEPVK